MNWKAWIATNSRGTPIALDELVKAFPIEVSTYTVTKLGADGQPESNTKQMTLANLDVIHDVENGRIRIAWDYGLTVTMPPQQVAEGSVSVAKADVMALRKLGTTIAGHDPETGEPQTKPTNVYSISAREDTGLLIIEIIDMGEKLSGEQANIVVAKA